MIFADLGKPRVGMAWMICSGLAFVVQNGIVRHMGADIHALQSAFIRFVWGVILLAPMLPHLLRHLPVKVMPLLLWRGVFHAAAVVLWFYAMVRIPIAQVTAIGYLNPVLMLLAGSVLLGESLPLRRILAVVAALLGALIVLRPGVQALNSGHFAQIGAAVCFCGSYLLAKRLSSQISASVIVAMMSLVVVVILAPLAWVVWEPVTWVQVLWLGGVAVMATLGHYCMTRAFRAAPLAVTQPVVFLQLVWATILGATMFGEAVDAYVLTGGGLIIGAISWLAWRDHQSAATLTEGQRAP
jgi:drug/metabolite transporter (DMT)-like permease